MSRLAFLSPSQARPACASSRRCGMRSAPALDDVSHLGKLELRGALDAVEPAPGEELLRLAPAARCSSPADAGGGARRGWTARACASTT